MAGGGVKGGFSYGATDEFWLSAVENRVHVHDLHATILHFLGLDHEKLTYRYSGRDYRLTDVHGQVIKEFFHKKERQRSRHLLNKATRHSDYERQTLFVFFDRCQN